MSSARGASLAELLVALTLLATGGSLSARLLSQATREMESAEIGLRAVLFLAERWESATSIESEERPAGPGLLIGEGAGIGARVRYDPQAAETESPGGRGGFLRARDWAIEGVGGQR
jgi:hypothetical protein